MVVAVSVRTYLTTILLAIRYTNNDSVVVVVVLVRTYLTTILSAIRCTNNDSVVVVVLVRTYGT